VTFLPILPHISLAGTPGLFFRAIVNFVSFSPPLVTTFPLEPLGFLSAPPHRQQNGFPGKALSRRRNSPLEHKKFLRGQEEKDWGPRRKARRGRPRLRETGIFWMSCPTENLETFRFSLREASPLLPRIAHSKISRPRLDSFLSSQIRRRWSLCFLCRLIALPVLYPCFVPESALSFNAMKLGPPLFADLVTEN